MEPLVLLSDSAETTRGIAGRLAGLLRAGDLIILSGSLGAGKTTFTQGLAQALGVQDRVLSPTFVLVRTHSCPGRDFELVHVDAYRLADPEDIDQLDLESTLGRAVTVVEWGQGRVEHLSESYLHIDIGYQSRRAHGRVVAGQGPGADPAAAEEGQELRRFTISASGPRWHSTHVSALAGPAIRATTTL